jgi:hypothetical protein
VHDTIVASFPQFPVRLPFFAGTGVAVASETLRPNRLDGKGQKMHPDAWAGSQLGRSARRAKCEIPVLRRWLPLGSGLSVHATLLRNQPMARQFQNSGTWPTTSFKSMRAAEAVGIGIWETAFQDADLAGSSPIRKQPAAQGDCVLDFRPPFPLVILKDSTPMTISMYKASAPIFVQFLTSLSAVLDKAAAHAEAKKIDPAVLLNGRLYPDMFPLARQVREATNHAASACGRVASTNPLTFNNTEASIPDLKERIAKTIDFIKSLKPTQIDGTEDKEITMKFTSGERKFTGQAFLLNFGLPNFFFHYTTAYDILRSCGVEVGKRDFMGTPVTLP